MNSLNEWLNRMKLLKLFNKYFSSLSISDPKVLMSQMQIKTRCEGGSKSRDKKVFTFCQNGQCCSTSPLLFLNENCKEKNFYETTEIGECAQFKFGGAQFYQARSLQRGDTVSPLTSHFCLKWAFQAARPVLEKKSNYEL